MQRFLRSPATRQTEQNKRTVQRYYQEILNQRDLSHATELFAPHFLSHPQTDLATYLNIIRMTYQAFPDLQVTIDTQVGEGDMVATRWHANATHEGVYFGIPPTGKTLVISAMHFHRLTNGQLAEHWEQFDLFGTLRQLGVVQLPGAN